MIRLLLYIYICFEKLTDEIYMHVYYLTVIVKYALYKLLGMAVSICGRWFSDSSVNGGCKL